MALRWSVLIPALMTALALGACASGVGERSTEERAADWNAQNVYPTNYRAELLAYLRTYLNDPTGVREAGISEPALRPAGFGERYVVCVRFNAKGAGGGYAGAKEHLVIYVGGKLDRYVEAGAESCKAATYAAFPELERLAR
jgi:hypothetical protein